MALHTVLYYQWEYCPGNEGGGKGTHLTPCHPPPLVLTVKESGFIL